VESRNAVHAVAIDERQGTVAELRRTVHEDFRQRRALEEAEGGRRVQFYVHASNP
jgi:hypothetical protein